MVVPTQVLLLSPGVVLGSPAPSSLSSEITQLSPLWPSIPLDGKNQVWQHDVIPILVHLLKDNVEEVQANAAGALMYAMVTTQGEVASCIRCAGVGVTAASRMLAAPASFPELSFCAQHPGNALSLPYQNTSPGLLLKSFTFGPRFHRPSSSWPQWVTYLWPSLVTPIRTSVPSYQAIPWAWNSCLQPRPLVCLNSGMNYVVCHP